MLISASGPYELYLAIDQSFLLIFGVRDSIQANFFGEIKLPWSSFVATLLLMLTFLTPDRRDFHSTSWPSLCSERRYLLHVTEPSHDQL